MSAERRILTLLTGHRSGNGESLRTGRCEVRTPRGNEIFPRRRTPSPTQPPVLLVPGLYLGVKRPGLGDCVLVPSSTVV